jgi:hypothetical protein
MRKSVRWLVLASTLVLCVGSGAAVSDSCSTWPNHKPTNESVSAKDMLIDISKIGKEKLKKDGHCAGQADPRACRRQWTAVLGAARRVQNKGKTWQIGCDDQWKNVKAALEAANAGDAAACFGHLDYQKGN